MSAFQKIYELALEGSESRLGRSTISLDKNIYRDAAISLLSNKEANFVIATGFPVRGNPETDGPPGTFFLYETLAKVGIRSTIAGCKKTIDICRKARPDAKYLVVPATVGSRILFSNNKPCELITIEICGACEDGVYRNMHGEDITDECAKFEFYFGSTSLISIGDGGNEFGMGSLEQNPLDRFRTPISKSSHLLPASISNFGAYALARCIEIIEKIEDPIEINDHLHLIRKLIRLGLVDGFSGAHAEMIDGRDISHTKNFLEKIRGIIQ